MPTDGSNRIAPGFHLGVSVSKRGRNPRSGFNGLEKRSNSMPNIEWQDTEELRPIEYSLEYFCLQNNLPWDEIKETQGTMAFIEKRALESLHDFLAHDTKR